MKLTNTKTYKQEMYLVTTLVTALFLLLSACGSQPRFNRFNESKPLVSVVSR